MSKRRIMSILLAMHLRVNFSCAAVLISVHPPTYGVREFLAHASAFVISFGRFTLISLTEFEFEHGYLSLMGRVITSSAIHITN